MISSRKFLTSSASPPLLSLSLSLPLSLFCNSSFLCLSWSLLISFPLYSAKGGAAKKAENEKIKAAEEAAKKEAQEAASWDKGAKGKGAAEKKAEKAAEEARKKAEKERLKAEDEASLPDKPVKASGGAKKAGAKKESKPAFNGPPGSDGIDGAIQTFNADNIDDALDALDLTTERTDKAALGSKAAAIESHPERRFKVSTKECVDESEAVL